MIAVGIVSQDRGKEFSPSSSQLQAHLREEVFPLIEQYYRVFDFRAVIGHSWGGAFVGNVLFSEQRDLFDAYIGISPSLGAHGGVILDQANDILSEGVPLGKFLYCSSGDLGISEFETQDEVDILDSLINTYPNKTLAWQTDVFSNTDHWSCVIPSINRGLIQLSRNYLPDQQTILEFTSNPQKSIGEQIEDFNQAQEENFGFAIKPSLLRLGYIADNFRQLGKHSDAVALYLFIIDHGDDRVVTYFDLAQTYDMLADSENARKAFKESLSLLEAQKDQLSEGFYRDLLREIRSRLGEH